VPNLLPTINNSWLCRQVKNYGKDLFQLFVASFRKTLVRKRSNEHKSEKHETVKSISHQLVVGISLTQQQQQKHSRKK
jgi:hypothetical protein